ncbi:MAG: protease inhibitor I42 family protein [Oscillospiraceae bacterium]|nr:protease inhibitor I42 family protein [Oscillospiraceae bacterium]
MVFCPNCGAKVNEAKFCSSCGQPLAKAQPQTVSALAPVPDKKKKSKAPFVVAGGLVVAAALAVVLVFTNLFGLLNKNDGGFIKTTVEIDGVKQNITSAGLDGEKTVILKTGEICHFRGDEKQSIPYRWKYYISDENVIGFFHSEYEDDSGPNPMSGGDKGYRWFYFKALAPGECVITLRYGRIDEQDEDYSEEQKFTIKVTAEPASSGGDAISGKLPDNLLDLPTAEGIDAAIMMLETYVSQAGKLNGAGLVLQADWFYSYAAASAAAMRVCLDANIIAKGGNAPVDTAARLSGWDEIGRLNIACPFVWAYESVAYRVAGKDIEADEAWENARQHPAFYDFDDPMGDVFVQDSLEVLITARNKIAGFEDRLYALYNPVIGGYPRDPKGWDDGYLCSLGTDVLRADETDIDGALWHFRAALAADPFDGGNFAACSLMCMYREDMDGMFFYLNEGLKIAPDHEGLKNISAMLEAAAVNIGDQN